MENKLKIQSIKKPFRNLQLDLDFDEHIMFLTGDSGTGKSFLYTALYNLRDVYRIRSYNAHDYKDRDNIKRTIETEKGVLFVFDNADSLLTPELRKTIREDTQNQFLIIGRNTDDLFLRRNCLVDLEISQNKVRLIHTW